MAIISYAKTLDEYMRGLKTCTRRNWEKSHMARWQRWWDEDKLIHDAWSQLPHVPGAHKIGVFRLLCRPYWERLGDMPVSDLIAEGGMCATLDEFYRLIDLPLDKRIAVVRFIPLHVTFRKGVLLALREERALEERT